MAKVFILSLILCSAILKIGFSQSGSYTSANNRTGNWETASMWTKEFAWMSNPPPNSTVSFGVNINGYVTRNGSLSFSGGDAIMDVYDTLVITGNLTLSSGNIRHIVVHNGGVLIVLGDFTANNNNTALVNVNAGGNFVVVGNYNQQQGSVTTTGGFYVFDNTPTFNWGSSVDGTGFNNNTGTLGDLMDNEDDLVSNNKPLNAFLETLGVTAACSATFDYTTRTGAGSWTNSNSWSGNNNPPYTLSAGSYTIPATDIVTIESGNFSLTSNLIVYGTLIVNGTLNMTGAGTVIDIQSGGSVTCCQNCNASNKINIGGNTAWTGNDGTVSGPAIINSTGVLPITLIFFKGAKDESGIKLTWATATEENFDKFIVERSSDGIDFVEMGEVNGAGVNTKDRRDYSFTDDAPLAYRNYYRLKNLDLDGKVDYSNIVKVETENEQRIYISPNPVVDESLTLRINFEPMQFDKIQILSAVGNILLEYPVTSLESNINLNGKLNSGVYILRYVSKQEEKTLRFVVYN